MENEEMLIKLGLIQKPSNFWLKWTVWAVMMAGFAWWVYLIVQWWCTEIWVILLLEWGTNIAANYYHKLPAKGKFK